MRKAIFTIVGAIMGIPLSYYFQPEMVRAKVGGFVGYIKHFEDIVNQKDLTENVVISVVVFAVIGLIIGVFADNNFSSIKESNPEKEIKADKSDLFK